MLRDDKADLCISEFWTNLERLEPRTRNQTHNSHVLYTQTVDLRTPTQTRSAHAHTLCKQTHTDTLAHTHSSIIHSCTRTQDEIFSPNNTCYSHKLQACNTHSCSREGVFHRGCAERIQANEVRSLVVPICSPSFLRRVAHDLQVPGQSPLSSHVKKTAQDLCYRSKAQNSMGMGIPFRTLPRQCSMQSSHSGLQHRRSRVRPRLVECCCLVGPFLSHL